MRKLAVPYTIKRNGVYYLNLRWQKSFIRWSLSTTDATVAFNVVNEITPLLANDKGCEQTIRQQVASLIGKKQSPVEVKTVNSVDSEPLILLSEGFRLYTQEQSIENWGERTASQNKATFGLLVEIIGDIPVTQVSKVVVREFKQVLLSYPSNRNKGSRKEKTLKELAEEGCPTISLETVRNIIGRVSSFFNWLSRQGFRDNNPFVGAAPRRAHSARSERSSFNQKELQMIFGTSLFTDKQYTHEWQYWLPLLGLFTGARLEELCQLKIGDIKREDDVYYLDIHGDGDPQNRVKTACSIRQIPVHQTLIDKGFLRLDHKCAQSPQVFDLRRVNTNLGYLPSKWFGRYKTSLGLSKGTKVFHSFRHTLRDKLTLTGAPTEHIREILGHEQIGETFGRYGSSIPVSILAKSLAEVDFDGVFIN